MNVRLFLTVIFLTQIISVCTYAEPVPVQLIGKVSVGNSTKLDLRGKKQLLLIADKIKENVNKSAVIITGNAKNKEDYITHSVFTARTVEMHLRSLLPGSYQFFVTASRFTGEKKSGQSSVIIYLYPHELMVADEESALIQGTSQAFPKKSASVSAKSPISDTPPAAQSSILTPPPAEDETIAVTSKKQRSKERIENPVLADELVRKAKARAAAKAKQLE